MAINVYNYSFNYGSALNSILVNFKNITSKASRAFLQCIPRIIENLKFEPFRYERIENSFIYSSIILSCFIGYDYFFTDSLSISSIYGLLFIAFLTYSVILSNIFLPKFFHQFQRNIRQQGHWLNLAGTVSHPIWKSCPFEGEHSVEFFIEIKKQLLHFFQIFDQNLQLSDEKRSELIEALDFAITENDPEKIASRIKEGKLTIFEAGWTEHSIAVAFFGNTFAIGNRGDGSDSSNTLTIHSFNPNSIDPLIVETLANTKIPRNEKMDFLYNRLFLLLSSHSSPWEEIFLSKQPSHQKVGNCSLTSKKAILRFVWTMLLSASPNLEAFERGCLEAKIFNIFAALEIGLAPLPRNTPLECLRQKEKSMMKKVSRYYEIISKIG